MVDFWESAETSLSLRKRAAEDSVRLQLPILCQGLLVDAFGLSSWEGDLLNQEISLCIVISNNISWLCRILNDVCWLGRSILDVPRSFCLHVNRSWGAHSLCFVRVLKSFDVVVVQSDVSSVCDRWNIIGAVINSSCSHFLEFLCLV